MFRKKVLLSIITPFYAKNNSCYLPRRALDFVEQSFAADWIERIIVDQGSPASVSSPLKEACDKRGFRYIKLDNGHLPFSAGSCRNFGVQVANGEFVTFQDVDLFGDDSVYDKIRNNIESCQVPFNYLDVIPCLYLTDEGTALYLNTESTDRASIIDKAYFESDSSIIRMIAPASSSLIVKKSFYLTYGGVRPEFFGHGYEDFELLSRLAFRSNKFYRSHDYYSHNYQYDSLEYKGYRPYFSMFGRSNLYEHQYFVHLYHEAVENIGYRTSNARNRAIFEKSLKSFDKVLDEPPALSDLTSETVVLCIGSRTSLPYKSIRMALPHLGQLIYRHETDFRDIDEFSALLSSKKISRVVFPTPYGNENRLQLYQWCKNQKFPFLIFDRGALPDSWFFDSGGFNAESTSYSLGKWDFEISDCDLDKVEQYVHELCSSDETLEENGARVGEYNFRRKYDLLDKKVIFVPLQRHNDSVIKYLSGNVDSVDHFCQEISCLAQLLPHDWRIVVKQHPLETGKINIPGTILLASNVHVYDAISAADAIVLINSGVGLLSLCFDKPTFCFGRSFYVNNGLAEQVSDAQELVSKLLAVTQVDRQKLYRFMHYLVFNFYSFAKAQYRKFENGDSTMNAAVNLQFSVIRIPDQPEIDFLYREMPISTSAPAYDYFRAYFKSYKPKDSKAKKKSVGSDNNAEVKTLVPTVVFSDKIDSELLRQSATSRKFRKLMREPAKFIKDAMKKRIGS